ncbi:MAG: flagellar hook protein FlgE [Firmicutes bacterium]|nr:flagellar hook protein FlgE [Dethiobacter sp.]MBS3888644.1 flagellar hook protein FlgE [Bacillota bacterium]
MLRSLFAAISGIRGQQAKLDTIGNNIANASTTGFKASRVRFQDMLSQTLRVASGPTNGRSGTNPSQVGLGMSVAGIDTLHTQGSLQATGRLTDLAVQGSGFFAMSDGQRTLFTRDGAFSISKDNQLVNASTGMTVMGWRADAAGAVNSQGAISPLSIPLGAQVLTQATTRVDFTGNLSSEAPAGTTHSTTATIYNSLGAPLDVQITFTRSTGVNSWDFAVAWPAGSPHNAVTITGGTGAVAFDTFGRLIPAVPALAPVSFTIPLSEPMSFNLDFAAFSMVAGPSTALVRSQDGLFPGELATFSIGRDGVITGTFTNGAVRDLGQIAIAHFASPEGLMKTGSNLYEASSSSGEAIIGGAGIDGRGTVETGTLEMSNVDLASEFTEMITTSRAFQANSRVVTTSDEMLQELIQLKR